MNPLTPTPNLSVLEQEGRREDPIGAAGRQLHYPHTPSLSPNSNPPLFDKLYYSPITSMRAERSLSFSISLFTRSFYNQQEGAPDVSLRDLRLNFHIPQQDPVDSIIDFDTMQLNVQARSQQSEKPSSNVQSPVKEEPRCTVFRFNSESVDDKVDKSEKESEVESERVFGR